MQEAWEQFWSGVTDAAHVALTPFRLASEWLGYPLDDIHIWCFLVALFFLALLLPRTWGDLVLMRRRALATGTVVKLDTSDDGPDTPVIDFRDASGKLWRFSSDLPVNGVSGTVGATVGVIYDPRNPGRAREHGRALSKAFHAFIWYSMIAVLLAFVFWPV